MPIALITGATAGIGEATAKLLARNGFDLIINGRRQERLDALSEELKKNGVRVLPLAFDVRDRAQVKANLENLPAEWKQVDVLINNAGLALGKELLNESLPEDWDVMIDTNIKGLLYVTHFIVPQMIERKHGHIVNLGSIAGKEVYKSGSVYNATKFAVEALTRGMRIDFLEHGIRVSSVCPGIVQTEFADVRFKGDTERVNTHHAGYEPLQGEDIADAIHWVITRPPHVNINDLLIMPTSQANTTHHFKKA